MHQITEQASTSNKSLDACEPRERRREDRCTQTGATDDDGGDKHRRGRQTTTGATDNDDGGGDRRRRRRQTMAGATDDGECNRQVQQATGGKQATGGNRQRGATDTAGAPDGGVTRGQRGVRGKDRRWQRHQQRRQQQHGGRVSIFPFIFYANFCSYDSISYLNIALLNICIYIINRTKKCGCTRLTA